MLGCKHPGISSSQSGAGFVLQDFALDLVFLQPLKYINSANFVCFHSCSFHSSHFTLFATSYFEVG